MHHRIIPFFRTSDRDKFPPPSEGPVFISWKTHSEESPSSSPFAVFPKEKDNRTGSIVLNGKITWETGFGFPYETLELLDALRGGGSPVLRKLILEIGSAMLTFSGNAATLREARFMIKEALLSGRTAEAFFKKTKEAGLSSFKDLIKMHNQAAKHFLKYPDEGYFFAFSRKNLDIALKNAKPKPPSTGLRLLKHTGDFIAQNTAVAEISGYPPRSPFIPAEDIWRAFIIKKDRPPYQPLIIERINIPPAV